MSGPGIYALRFKNGEPAAFPRSVAERIFDRGAIDSNVSSEIVRWSDGEAEIDIGIDDDIEGLHCERFTSLTFVERLYELAADVGLIMLWPGFEPGSFVPSEDVIAHLPQDFADDPPTVVRSARELIALLDIRFINSSASDRNA